MASSIYLIPTILYEDEVACIPAYVLEAIRQCSAFFVENERTARRYLKLLSKEIIIDNYRWFTIKELTPDVLGAFRNYVKGESTIGIISEAGCPGIADPGQHLVQIGQEMKAIVRPLVGPNSILLALMGSGMNGQHFQFVGYLPIDVQQRSKTLHMLEAESRQKNCTQIFIETPYRNSQLLETILKACASSTRICIAADLTSRNEMIRTQTVKEWKSQPPNLHKRPVIFLLFAGSLG